METGVPSIDAINFESTQEQLIMAYSLMLTAHDVAISLGLKVSIRSVKMNELLRVHMGRIAAAKDKKELVAVILLNKKETDDGLKADQESSKGES